MWLPRQKQAGVHNTWRPRHLSRVWKAETFQSDIIPFLGIQSDAVLTWSFGVTEGRGAASSDVSVNVKI